MITEGTFERKRITIRWGEDSWRRVRARVRESLAVHRTPNWSGTWSVSHIPTGTLIGVFDTEEGAIHFMRAINGVADWPNVKADGSPMTPDQREHIKALRKAFGGW